MRRALTALLVHHLADVKPPTSYLRAALLDLVPAVPTSQEAKVSR